MLFFVSIIWYADANSSLRYYIIGNDTIWIIRQLSRCVRRRPVGRPSRRFVKWIEYAPDDTRRKYTIILLWSLYYYFYRFSILTYCRRTSPGIRYIVVYIIYITCVRIGILASLYNVITTTIDRPRRAIFWPSRVFLREVFIELISARWTWPPSHRNHYRRKF